MIPWSQPCHGKCYNDGIDFFLSSSGNQCLQPSEICKEMELSQDKLDYDKNCLELLTDYELWCCPDYGSECFKTFVNTDADFSFDWSVCYSDTCVNASKVIPMSQPCHGKCYNEGVDFFHCSSSNQCLPLQDMCKENTLCQDKSVIDKCKECQGYIESKMWSCPLDGTECFKHYINNDTTFQKRENICYSNVCDNATKLISITIPCHGKCFDEDSQFLCSSGDQCVLKSDITTLWNNCEGSALCEDRSDIRHCKESLIDYYHHFIKTLCQNQLDCDKYNGKAGCLK